ncbi:MAG: AMP-binding protein [Thermoflexibacter sp.]|jgi:long-chain acyl-CoA synthetase|nr:AMP-binding protein [Thermoflexibacter sp.]
MAQQFPWFESYPKGTPTEINPDSYKNIIEIIEEAIKKYPNNTAFIHMDTSITFKEIDELSRSFAAFLQKKANLKQGDRVAIQMPNMIQYAVALFGILRAGMVVVNTNPLYTAREMEHQFKDSGAKAVVILANFAHLLAEVLPKTKIETVIVTEIGDMMSFPKRFIVNSVVKYVKKMVPTYNLPKAVTFRTALSQGKGLDYTRPEISSKDMAFLQYTGGTTGVSKGAILTQRNIVANVLQMKSWMSTVLQEGKELIVTALPLYHIFSLSVNCFSFFANGNCNLLITNPRDMKAFIADLKKHPFTAMTGVNTLYNGLLNQPEFTTIDFSKLKIAVGGAMAIQSIVAEKWKKVTGVPLSEGYGLTESSPVLCSNPLNRTERVGTIGVPVPSTEIKIVTDDNVEASFGERGEIWATGPQIMAGYWERPDETDKVIAEWNGKRWLKTGDIGIAMDGGFFKIVDRKKDMILVSGFNVYPNEVEDVVATHPKVLEVAAVGVPDDKSTEAVKIFVVKKDESLTEAELREFCKEQLTGYKQPKHIEFRKDLPKTNVGKILRRALREA